MANKKFLDYTGLEYFYNKLKEAISNSALLGDGYSQSEETNENLMIEQTDTINGALGKLEKAIIDNEQVFTNATESIANSVGLSSSLEFTPSSSSTYASASNIVEAIDIISIAMDSNISTLQSSLTSLQSKVTNLEDLIANIDVTIPGVKTGSATNSLALNSTTTNSGPSSIVMGTSCTNTQSYSFVGGNTCSNSASSVLAPNFIFGKGLSLSSSTYGNTMFGNSNTLGTSTYYSTVTGYGNDLTGNYAFFNGYNNSGTGSYSGIFGSGNNISCSYSIVGGTSNIVSANYCGVIGSSNNISSSSSYSFVSGSSNDINYNYALVGGLGNTVNSSYELVSGKYSSGKTSATMEIGYGTSTSKKNVFRVTTSGSVYGTGSYNSSGADYAEMFEWIDDNPDSEDRIGYFVTIEGEKIKKASSQSDFIIGITSGTANIIGNNPEDWYGREKRDELGRRIFEDVLDENTGVTEKLPVDAEDYDSSKEYISRSDRKEWAPVGLMGQIRILQDGTLNVGDRCICNENGMATKSSDNSGWYVMKIISENVALILFK